MRCNKDLLYGVKTNKFENIVVNGSNVDIEVILDICNWGGCWIDIYDIKYVVIMMVHFFVLMVEGK